MDSPQYRLFNTMTLNINGFDNKIYELNALLNKYKPDVLCLQETLIEP